MLQGPSVPLKARFKKNIMCRLYIMSVANFPYQEVKFFASSGNAARLFPGNKPLDDAPDALSPALILNGDGSESTVTLSAGVYSCSATTYVNIAAAQTACQKLELGVHELDAMGAIIADPAVKGPTFSAYAGAPLGAGVTLAMVAVQIHLTATDPFFVVAATTRYVLRVNYNGMPINTPSSANFSAVSFYKIQDESVIRSVNFKT